jgi:hypothetical protein
MPFIVFEVSSGHRRGRLRQVPIGCGVCDTIVVDGYHIHASVTDEAFQSNKKWGKKMNILELRKTLAVLLLSFMVATILPACSSSEEEAPPPESQSAQDEVCDEMDAGAENCDDIIQ